MQDGVAVVIVAYRTPGDVARCLECIAALDHVPVEIAICENGGVEAFDQLAAHLVERGLVDRPWDVRPCPPAGADRSLAGDMGSVALTLHRSTRNGGYAAGVNLALRSLTSPWRYVWILNPDTQPEPTALSALVAHAEAGGYGCVGSRLVLQDTGRIEMYGGLWRRLVARGIGLGFGDDRDASPDIPAVESRLDWVCGAALFASRDFVATVGPMDERYFLYGEEVDWCLRRGAATLGYAHSAIVSHGFGRSAGSSFDPRRRSPLSAYLEERNRLLLARRHSARLYPVVLVVTLVLTALYLRKAALLNFGFALRGWTAGALGFTGIPAWYARREARRQRT